MTALICCMREFDYMIEDLREQGQIKDIHYIKEEKDNLINIRLKIRKRQKKKETNKEAER